MQGKSEVSAFMIIIPPISKNLKNALSICYVDDSNGNVDQKNIKTTRTEKLKKFKLKRTRCGIDFRWPMVDHNGYNFTILANSKG